MASAEARPLAQTGGLADVLRALPDALARQGLPVRRLLPAYGFIDRSGFALERATLAVPLGPARVPVRFHSRTETSGVVTTLVECEEMFARDQIYGPPGGEYRDNARRFTLFARAVFERAARAGERPDILHLHDWHAALAPLFVRFAGPRGKPPRTVLTIHNLAHQGRFGSWEIDWISVPEIRKAEITRPEGIEFHGGINFLKAGIVYADALTTVSPTYAAEILTPELGCDLDPLLRAEAGKLTGILNGADYDLWDPASDPHLPQRYGADRLEGKTAAARTLREKLSMPASDRPLVGVVSRLVHQKGIDVVIRAAPGILEAGADLAVLGSGEPELVRELESLRGSFSGRIGIFIGHDEPLAHRVTAGSDLMLVPSRYEPCGLVQMHAMRYGALPVASRTGGLADTVRDESASPGRGNGFLLPALTPDDLAATVARALALRRSDPAAWTALQRRAMAEDFSWDRAARRYAELYRSLLA